MAYTYHLYHIPTRRHYYGSRYAKDANPADLWITYFSSSNEVKILIEQYGKDSFEYTIRREFENPKDAILWESKFLQKVNAKNNPSWINQHNRDGKFSSYGLMPLYQRKKISNANKGKIPWIKGKHHKEVSKQKISENNLGKNTGPLSQEHKKNISDGMKKMIGLLSDSEKISRVKNSCCADDSYTKERSKKISIALIGKKKSKQHCFNISKSKKELIKNMTELEIKNRFGKQNKGKTWRLINGKRQWFNKENE